MSAFLIGDQVQQPTDLIVAHAIEAASQRHDVPAPLLRSLAFQDSGYDGVLFRPFRWDNGCRTDGMLLNPVLVADVAAMKLATWFKTYRGSWVHVLAAWRIGPQRVENMRRGKTFQLSQVVHDYIGQVLAGAGMPQPIRLHNGMEWV